MILLNEREMAAAHLRSAHIEWLSQHDWAYFVTLIHHRFSGNEMAANRQMRNFLFQLQGDCLGKKFKNNYQKQTGFIKAAPFLEDRSGNLHWHILFSDPALLSDRYQATHLRESILSLICAGKHGIEHPLKTDKSGIRWFQRIRPSPDDRTNVLSYVSKTLAHSYLPPDALQVDLLYL